MCKLRLLCWCLMVKKSEMCFGVKYFILFLPRLMLAAGGVNKGVKNKIKYFKPKHISDFFTIKHQHSKRNLHIFISF